MASNSARALLNSFWYRNLIPFSRRDRAAEVAFDSLKSRGVFSGAGVGVPKSGICLRGDNVSEAARLLELLFSETRVFGWLLDFFDTLVGDFPRTLLGDGDGFRVSVLGLAGALILRLVCVFDFPPALTGVFFL